MKIGTRDTDPLTAATTERGALRQLAELLDRQPENQALLVTPAGESVELPETAYHALRQIVRRLASDEAVALVPVSRELTTQQAADLLNVSRPFLIQLLDRGELPHHRVGTHRRIGLADLLTYKTQRDADRREGLRELTRTSQRLGLYGPRTT